MANLLFRLGTFSAKRAWAVIIAWLLILGTAVGLMAGFSGKLSSSMSIDGIPSQDVIDRLADSFPEAARGQGQVVFHKEDSPFTQAEIDVITAALEETANLSGVASVLNPFEVADEIASQRAELADGEAEIENAKQEIADGKVAIADGLAEIATNQKTIDDQRAELETQKTSLEASLLEIEAGLAQMQAAGAPAAMQAELLGSQAIVQGGLEQIRQGEIQLNLAQEQLDAGLEELTQSQLDLEAGELELQDAIADLEVGKRLVPVTENFGTVSSNGLTAVAAVQFTLPVNAVESATTESIVELLTELRSDTIAVEFSQSLTTDFGELLGVGEIVGLVIAAIVLFVMLGSLIAAGLPVISAVLGVGISASITMALSGTVEMTSTTPILGLMLGLAVGIDYSLFLLNRHRKQLKTGMELRYSIGLATGTSGNAVTFAGLTVIIALAALNLTGIGFLGLMGTMGAVAIALAVLIALTFTPALMGVVGMKVLNKRERAALESEEARHEAEEPKNALKPVLATRHPVVAVLAVGLLLGVAAIPASEMRLGLPDGSSEPLDSTTYRAFSLISENFGAGANGQISTVVTMPEAIPEDELLALQADLAEKFFELDNVMAALPAAVSEDQETILFQVIPLLGPASEETEQLVFDIRGLEEEIRSEFDAQLGVTGITATNIDVSDKLAEALPLYLGTVLLLSLILLILVFRSILVPLLASAGFLLTVFATFGAVVAVYQWGWLGFLFGVHDPGPILNFLPTILIGILFGLAMDYQLFLASGIREAYVHGKSPKDAINYGIHLSRAVVVAAALIMITVFGGFAFNHLALVRPIGFGLAMGVLIDAFLVRLILVPAVMSLLGKSAWWLPKWLDKILPNVDVEGSSLEREKDKTLAK
uniref:MMPL family transporter n=1 Tax=Aquiluna sp. TaxID=2053504 RepID=UPI0040472C50